ncbi:MAG TPA: hypothetical protein VIO33_15140 [Burkholderiaceae bacterium]
MPNALSVRFLTPDDVACPFVQYRLRLRAEPEAPYAFERARFRSLVQQIVQALPAAEREQCIDIVEVYTGNKYVAAIEYAEGKSVLLDYGFVELLVDNIALEYLTFRTEREMRAWFAAGQPEDWQVDESFAKFDIDGKTYAVTGSMMLRDVACKFLNDIVPDAPRRERLMAKLLWRDEHGGRPNAPYFLHLSTQHDQANVMPPFVADADAQATLLDQAALVAAFVTCHEISHLVYGDEAQAELRASRLVQNVLGIVEQLGSLRVEDDEGHRYVLGDLTAAARALPQVYERLFKEALVDIRAVEMLIEHERRRVVALDRWSTYLANLFGLISMTNSLGIFRSHLEAAIRDRSVAMADIRLARSEAVTRNLIVLAYLLYRNQNLAGKGLADELLPKIHLESLVLMRRMIYFQLDLVANVGEDRWKEFIDSALA